MCAVTMFYQDVELKYHQLCQGDQEAATSEESSNQGGIQFAVCKVIDAVNLIGAICFSDGIQR